MGTTGSSDGVAMNSALPDIIARVREYATVPIAVGFGVSTRAHFDTVADAGADGVVIGTRIVKVLKEAPDGQGAKVIEEYCREISGKGRTDQPHRKANLPPRVTSPAPVNVNNTGPPVANTASEPTVLPARFGAFGGQYVPESLVDCLVELEAAHKAAMADPEFWDELKSHFNYMNRPSQFYLAEHLTKEAGGANIWLKREDL